jgi:predicted tellurium resistance membrane protein TerC
MLALAFLILIGVNLLAEGLHQHIPKGYTYFAMAFSVFVELLNLRLRKASTSSHPVELRSGYVDEKSG